MITAVTFTPDGKVFFRNRFVRTEGYDKEEKEMKICYRGAFRTMKPGGILPNFLDTKVKNVANTNIIYWGKKLLALWEGSLPYEMCPDTLTTINAGHETSLNGVLGPRQQLTAHPKICANSNRLVAFAPEPGIFDSTIRALEFDKDFALVKERSFKIPGFPLMHDFLVTENYYLFLMPPATINIWSFILGLKVSAAARTLCATFIRSLDDVTLYLCSLVFTI